MPAQQLSQQPIQYQQRNTQCTNLPTEQVEPTANEQTQTWTPQVSANTEFT